LGNFGVEIWLDRDKIIPGQRWKDAISKAIRQGSFLLACYSKELNARKETYMHGELRLAIERLRRMPNDRIWFIPIFLNEAEIPVHAISDHEKLSDIQAVPLYTDWGVSLKKILLAMGLDVQIDNILEYVESQKLQRRRGHRLDLYRDTLPTEFITEHYGTSEPVNLTPMNDGKQKTQIRNTVTGSIIRLTHDFGFIRLDSGETLYFNKTEYGGGAPFNNLVVGDRVICEVGSIGRGQQQAIRVELFVGAASRPN
jgi:hypothetical protein